LGDSPVIIRTDKGEYWHAPEHNVRSNPAEVIRIKAMGGTVYGGYAYPPRDGSFTAGGLQLSRTLGDSGHSAILSREPEIFEIPLGERSFVLVGTDGLFDPSHNSSEPASSIVALINKGASADDLVKYAIGVPTHDNVTAILVKII